MNVDLVLPIHQGLRHLESGVLDAVRGLDPAPAAVVVVDDGSTDGGAEAALAALPGAALVEHERARGFAVAANAGVRATSSPAVLVLNQDCALPPEWLGRSAAVFGDKPQAAACSGLLLRPEGKVDSGGHLLWSDWVCTERWAGSEPPALPEAQEVFGLSATATVYRRAALEEAAVEGEFFDESFGSYLEDVDLNIRLRHLGWESWLLPGAPAVHDRGSSGARKSIGVRRQGTRNYLAILAKNLARSERLRAALPCALGHLWGVVRDPLAFSLDPGDEDRLTRWRIAIRERRRVPPAELRRWIAGFRLNPWRQWA